MMRQAILTRLLTYAVAGTLVVFVGFPLLWMVLSSLKPSAELFVNPPRILPSEISFQWYANLVGSSDAVSLFKNSLIVGTSTTAILLGSPT